MLLDGLVVREEKQDGSHAQVVQPTISMTTTGMTPNPLLAFAMPSSNAAAATSLTVDVEKRQHFNSKNGDDDDDDEGGGSPNNPMDVPMRISIPESILSPPSIPMHMGSSISSNTCAAVVVVPNPIIMSSYTSSSVANGININTTSMMRYCDVPSPLASPTNTVDYEDIANKTTAVDNLPPNDAMAKVMVGTGSGNGDCGGDIKAEVDVGGTGGMINKALDDEDVDVNADSKKADDMDDCNIGQAVIFGEDHRSQSDKPQHQLHTQQKLLQQRHRREDDQQAVRMPSPASPPPPPLSTDMVRSFSFPVVGGGTAYDAVLLSGAHSSSGSLYSEHTAMSQSEMDSPTIENCWRNSSNSNTVANTANTVNHVTIGGNGGGRSGDIMEPHHHVMSDSAIAPMPRAQVHFRKNTPTTSSTSIADQVSSSSSALQAPQPPADKRQKRLERNRESARVSRRRRKFYLEELECKVTKLSEQMDTGRMKHACAALPSVRNARAAVLNDVERYMSFYPDTAYTPNPLSTMMMMTTSSEEEEVEIDLSNPHRKLPQQQQKHKYSASVHNIDAASPLFTQQLSRTNDELLIVQIFMKQQLASLVQPILTRFILWLSLQNEEYYRGGRSASERLSAARIGERLLHRGTRHATPDSGLMWPLICHEISLSYEQEEKVRTIQRLILSNVDSWIHRHTALATRNVMESIHEVFREGHAAAKSREFTVMKILTAEQRVKFLVWARRNSGSIRKLGEAKIRSGAVVSRRSWLETGSVAALGTGGEMTLECGDDEYMTSPDRHVAANLYIINHLLFKIKQRQQQKCISTTPTLFVHPIQLKKLSRRPSFESLAGLQAYEDSQISKKLSREASFPSTGSLKRSLNDMSLEGSHSDLHSVNSLQDATNNGITPMSAQSAGQAAVLAVLGDVISIVPRAGWKNPSISVTSAVLSLGDIATRGTSMTVGQTFATSQPPEQTFIPAPSVAHPPKRRHTAIQSPPMQQNVAAAIDDGVAKYQQQQHHHQHVEQPPRLEIPGVDDIPMPTPVSVLLRTSDDYFSLFEPHEPSSTTGYATLHYDIPYTPTNSNNTLLSSRHRSAPQLSTFSKWGSSPSHPTLPSAHMAVIPELEPVSVGVGVDFSTPDQMNVLPQGTTTDSILGNSHHQSAPQLYAEQPPKSLSGSLNNKSEMMPQANDFVSPDNDLLVEEFASLEGLPLNMEADDWAIGEGFDMDF